MLTHFDTKNKMVTIFQNKIDDSTEKEETTSLHLFVFIVVVVVLVDQKNLTKTLK